MKLRVDFMRSEHVPFDSTPWIASPATDVERKLLERDGGEIARATSFVRYRPGSSFPDHGHERGEEFVVLAGTFQDERGSYRAGTYVRNPPGSRHRPFSPSGCVIFVKLRQSQSSDARRCVIALDARPGVTELHAFGSERVSFVRLAAGETLELDRGVRGVELLVLEGTLEAGATRCDVWSWLRWPRAQGSLRARETCAFWLKQGHLPPT